MFKTIGMLAHVDAGKTTLAEQILFRCGAIRTAGRVDHGDTLLDHDAAERERGITIYADQAKFTIGKNDYYMVDTPGHVDFSAEMERTLQVLDAAILVSCVEGVQAHTESIWRLLEQYQIPVFFFLNKTDRNGANVERTMRQIRRYCCANAILLDGGLCAAAEDLASLDEALMEAFFDRGYDETLWTDRTAAMIRSRVFCPCFSGSALTGEGVDRFLSCLDRLTDVQYSTDGALSGVAYKVRHDASGTRLVFLKILSGVLHSKDLLSGEKIHEIRAYSGARYVSVPVAEAGQLCAVTGSTLRPGDTFGAVGRSPAQQMTPLLSAAVLFDPSVPAQTVLEKFRVLEAEEPLMAVQWQPALQQIQISVMGPIQLEILTEQCLRRFGLTVSFGAPDVLYQETIEAPVYGCGHFEPLRHYAGVHILLRPLPRGSGIRFSSACPTDVLRLNWQRLIETHVFEKTHRGALCGFPVTDIEVVLLTGCAHEKHTEGGDFRQALYRAVRHALFHAQSVLLEPYYRFVIRVPDTQIGRLLSDLEKRSAVYDAPLSDGNEVSVSGRCPVSELMSYSAELAAFTKGRGVLQMMFDGYERCHDSDSVIEAHPYAREADLENTADSVFCSHGAGYTVHWTEAASKMHCAVDKHSLAQYLNQD